ncbi:MAG TPA: hypothetical protein VHW95_11935 [Steroidobacteraceae bacterium]|jgi:hypothetical protein|nr:hypothetical protein [Steroidobacteraceae bacterium]
MFRGIIAAAVLTPGIAMAGAFAQGTDLTRFMGHWTCMGKFSNGTPIAANLSITADAPSGALIVRHDDVAPGAYHSLEVWMPNKSGSGLRAALSDKYSGMRWLESNGWMGNSLTFVRMENGVPAEQFAYEFKSASMQVQWSVARNGAMKVGDTLACSRV